MSDIIIDPRKMRIMQLVGRVRLLLDQEAYDYEVIDIFCALANIAIRVALEKGVRAEAVRNAFLDLMKQAEAEQTRKGKGVKLV